MTTKIDTLNVARTNLLNAYLDVLDKNLAKAKELGEWVEDAYVKDSKILRIQVGRRMGSSTWVKDYLINNPDSDVICTEEFKQRFYNGLNAVSIDTLIMTPPTAFDNHIVFIDLPPAKVDKVLEKYSFTHFCRCIVII